MQVLPMGYAQCLRWDGTLGTLSVKLAVHVWVQRHVEFMERERRKLLVVADDKDVAEVAAFGLRMYEGWEPVIATSPAEAIEIASTGAFVGSRLSSCNLVHAFREISQSCLHSARRSKCPSSVLLPTQLSVNSSRC